MIILETLSDHLFHNGITRKEACKLFGRSPRTLKRWENEPPEWVLRIVRLMGKKPAFPDCWYNWSFEGEYIVDEAGNKFHINDVRTIFWTRQLTDTLTGSQSEVYSLKQHLKNQIKKQPVLKITLEQADTNEHIKQWSIAL